MHVHQCGIFCAAGFAPAAVLETALSPGNLAEKNVSKRNITGLQSGHNNDVMLFNVMWNHVSQSIVKGAGDPTPSLAHLKIPDGFWPGPILK